MAEAPGSEAPPPLASVVLGAVAVGLVARLSSKDAFGLQAVIHAAAAYANINAAAKTVFIDKRAILLALVEAGLPMTVGKPNAAHWFAGWLGGQVREVDLAAVQALRTREEALAQAQADSFKLDLSSSVKTWVNDAAKLSRVVRRTPQFALRHFVAAGLEGAGELKLAADELKWPLSAQQMEDARRDFLEWVSGDLYAPESRASWAQALNLTEPKLDPVNGTLNATLDPVTLSASGTVGGGSTTSGATRTIRAVSGFSADRPSTDDSDPLGIGPDVTAFARLIAYRGTTTPLAIGIFGPWGSGKSTFMERLDREIDRLTNPPAPEPRVEGFVSRVVHIRFNAWTFADANLWASLGSEFFDQLRAGGYRRQGERIHAQLVERVTAHVHELQRAAEATREKDAKGQKELASALEERDKAVRNSPKVTQMLLDGLSRLTDERGSELAALFRGKDEAEAATGLVSAARASQTFVGQVGLVLTTAVRSLSGSFVLLLLVLLAGGVAALVGDWFDVRTRLTEWLHLQVPPILAGWIAITLAPLLPGLWSGLRAARAIAADTAAFAGSLKKADEAHLKTVFAAEAKLKAASDEASARRAASERAGRALARYIDPKGAANPPRVLRYILEDDPQTRLLEEQLGLISRTRRLFQAVDEVLRDPVLPRDADTPDRIVIYIDDLDRCSYEDVRKVLQAVHLLLAFERFVVVVGVDQKWVEEALAQQFAGADGKTLAETEAVRRRRAIDYLEKIFQLPFWLRPLRLEGDGAGAYTAYVEALTKAPEPPPPPKAEPPPAAPAAPAAEAKSGLPGAWTDAVESSGKQLQRAAQNLLRAIFGGKPEPIVEPPATPPQTEPAAPAAPAASAASAADALETLALDPKEVAFLGSPAMAAVAGTTPRNVKRMINMYRIVRVRLADGGVSIMGDGKSALPVYPLIAFFAAVETGQTASAADGVYASVRYGDAGGLLNTVTDSLLRTAAKAVDEARGAPATYGDCKDVARLARRYSFNRVDLPKP